MRKKLVDMTGQQIGRWTVLNRTANPNGGRDAFWLCQCDCGTIRPVNGSVLRRGGSHSCGCLTTEQLVQRTFKHGDGKSKLHTIWYNMIARCTNPSTDSYHLYGARGIKVCAEWLDYLTFKSWAMNSGYDPQLTLERKDSNGNYNTDNCTWATVKEQANNRRTNHILTVNGTSLTIAQWADITGIKYGTLWRRIKLGWPPEKAIIN